MAPDRIAVTSIMLKLSIIFLKPNSLKSTMKVAIHGKVMDNITTEMTIS